jgi:hypothetical protein
LLRDRRTTAVSPGHDLPIEMFKGARMSNIFQIGPHVFNVFESGGRWRVSVNGDLVDDSFFSRSDAWAAGLAELDHIEPR